MGDKVEKVEEDPNNPPSSLREVRGWYAYEVAESAFQFGTVDLLAIFVTDQGQRFAQTQWCANEFNLFKGINGSAFDECFESFWALDFENDGVCQTGNLNDNFQTNSSCVNAGGRWIATWNPTAAIVDLFGFKVSFTATFQTVQTISTIIQIIVILLFGAVADFGNYRKRLWIMSNLIAFSALLAITGFPEDDDFAVNCAMLLITTTFLSFAIICYNAFLPLLVNHDPDVKAAYKNENLTLLEKLEVKETKSSNISSYGLIYGYTGTLLFLLVVLGIFAAEVFPATPEGETEFFRLSAGLCGVFSLGVTAFSASRLYSRPGPPMRHSVVTVGLRRLGRTLSHAKKLPNLLIFLFAFFLYSDGMSTIGGATAVFASQELQMGTTDILLLLLEALVIYAIGAAAMIYFKNRYNLNAKYIMLVNLLLFGVVPLWAIVALREQFEIYIIAVVYALNFGSLSALARSEYTNLIPRGHESEFFSLLQITDRGTAWLAPLILTIVATETGSFRAGFSTLVAFFYSGLLVFLFYSASGADEERHKFEQNEIERGVFLQPEEDL